MKGNKDTKKGRKMLLCSVALGNSYSIINDLKSHDECHNWILPPKGYDSLFVKGRNDSSKGLGVLRSEYILFNIFQAYPKFEIEYDLN